MTCVSGSNEGLLLLLLVERGEIFLWEDRTVDVDDDVVPLLAAVVVVAEDAGVREERFRAALIRTLTVDGIIMLLLLSSC